MPPSANGARAQTPAEPRSTSFSGYSDRHVPSFDNEQKNYVEVCKRVKLFGMRMKLEGKQEQAAIMLLGSLTSAAWQAAEPLMDNEAELESKEGVEKLLTLLDKRFKYDARTEMPTAFENYFHRSARTGRETLFEYINRVGELERRVKERNVELPDHIPGWMLMRKAGLREDQRALILSQCGRDLTFDKVAEALQLTFGQDSHIHDRRDHRRSPGHARRGPRRRALALAGVPGCGAGGAAVRRPHHVDRPGRGGEQRAR